MGVRSFVEGTQRGYIAGLRRVNKNGTDGATMLEEIFHDDGTSAGIQKAYKEASAAAASLISTWKHSPRLIRRRMERAKALR